MALLLACSDHGDEPHTTDRALSATQVAAVAPTQALPPEYQGRRPRFLPHQSVELTMRGEYEEVAGGIEFASALASSPDGRIFVSEFRTGVIKQLRFEGGTATVTPFAMVPLPPAMQGEQGLWNLALAPSGLHLYASAIETTDPEDSFRGTARVVRFQLLEDGSAGPLEEVCTGLPAAVQHSGGALAFDSNGMLYVSIGDLLDTQRTTQVRDRLRAAPSTLVGDLVNLAGVIIRVVPEECEQAATRTYGELVYAAGFRNVYGMTLAPGGNLYATENGPSCCDRIFRVEPGGDHGWPVYGFRQEAVQRMQADPNITPPLVFTDERTPSPTQIVYVESLAGAPGPSLIYGTYHAASLLRVDLAQDGRSVELEEALVALPVAQREEFRELGGIVGVAVAADGSLYFASLTAVYRLTGIEP